jgi:hypothetical protein
LDKSKKEHRDRLVTLCLVSVLLIALYGPAAKWFARADTTLYDQFATHVRNEPLADSIIISISPAKKSPQELSDTFGDVIAILKGQGVRRVILMEPPEPNTNGEFPGWAATLSSGPPVFVPSGTQMSAVASKSGIFRIQPDQDGIMRTSTLWYLQGGTMTPSLSLSIALDDGVLLPDSRISSTDDVLYLTNYSPLPRASAAQILGTEFEIYSQL